MRGSFDNDYFILAFNEKSAASAALEIENRFWALIFFLILICMKLRPSEFDHYFNFTYSILVSIAI